MADLLVSKQKRLLLLIEEWEILTQAWVKPIFWWNRLSIKIIATSIQ
jgi:hypothetical protein